jgi:hypothetical protein
MRKRVPQPPLNPAARDAERHDFWPGFIVCCIGGILAFAGLKHLTGIETVEGGAAREIQLVKAFASGGLQFPKHVPPPPPPRMDDPGAAAQALDRWARENSAAKRPSWKVRVDTGAKTPCPT